MSELSIIPTFIYISCVSYSYVLFIRIGAKPGDRNHPAVIKSRIIRVLLVTLINLIVAPYILMSYLKIIPNITSFYEVMGLTDLTKVENLIPIFKTLLIFMILFIGPIFELLLDFDYFGSQYSSNLQIFRDLFIAPITEEFFYTSLTMGSLLSYKLSLNLSLSSNTLIYSPKPFHNDPSVSKYLLLSPLFFGFAHLHHGIELRQQGMKLFQVLAICGFQCLYTTLFGYLTNLVFVNTGSLWCCFIAHSFCNFMGFPTLSINGNKFIKLVYYSLLIFGIYGFGKWFDKLTFDPII